MPQKQTPTLTDEHRNHVWMNCYNEVIYFDHSESAWALLTNPCEPGAAGLVRGLWEGNPEDGPFTLVTERQDYAFDMVELS